MASDMSELKAKKKSLTFTNLVPFFRSGALNIEEAGEKRIIKTFHQKKTS